MRIESIDPKGIVWGRGPGVSIYSDVYTKIEGMQVNEAITIEFDEPRKFFNASLTSNFKRKHADFSLKTKREDSAGRKWVVMKVKKVVNKKKTK